MSYAKTIILGNLTRDPELRVTPTGTAVCSFSIAVSRKFKQGEQEREQTSFFDCTAFAKTGENINKFFTKGKSIFVDARPEQQTWEDKETKAKRSKVVFIVEQFQFAGGDKTEGSQQQAPRSSAPRPQHAKPQENLDEDVPF